jgi:uncharacterized protein (TIGR01777 family)
MNAGKVGVIGASGWLGKPLCQALREGGWEVIGFSRSPREDETMDWRVWSGEGAVDLSELDAVINLAGESIDQRWTAARKVKFHKSRVELSQDLSRAIASSGVRVLLNASAIGIYGDRGDEKLPESAQPGEGYLAELCQDWEKAVSLPESVRVVFLRTGVVLGNGGGAWGRMKPIFNLGIGGRLGKGNQWMPWIHLDDEIGAIVHCLENEISGPVNLVAPGGVTNREFTKEVGRAMKRPTIFPAPAFALKLLLGDFAKEGLLASTRVVPQVLEESGFRFEHPTIGEALRNLMGESG